MVGELQRKLNAKEVIETRKEPVLRRQQLEKADHGLQERSLIVEGRHVIALDRREASTPPASLRGSSGIAEEDAARMILSLCRDNGTKAAGDGFSVLIVEDDQAVARFVGAVQRDFLAARHGVQDLEAGLAAAVEAGWLKVGPRRGLCGELATYVLTQAGLDSFGKLIAARS